MRDWESAWRDALYGTDGFFARGERPADHFRTAPLIGPELAEALVDLLARIDSRLGHPATLDFIDLGAGGGELAATVRDLATGDLARRLHVTAIELTQPAANVDWRPDLPESVVGLLVGHEWLDTIPCPVVTLADGAIRRLAVHDSGTEHLGAVATPQDLAWLKRWWPLTSEGERAEIGTPRDQAWADAVRHVRAGTALAIDYGHLRSDRPRYGTLTGYRHGKQVHPIPDGTRDLTAHVAVDACAAAVPGTTLRTQRNSLSRLTSATSAAIPRESLAGLTSAASDTDPMAWLRATARAGRIAELTSPTGLGAFFWLTAEIT